ncbi:PhzF family phenazine biosynthesis protein [Mesorhizobium sp. NZP2077]|uniref:PhzF family phenazine biosynthesis protein n=1 Tax=Mesorhizobium sp. NZP2077 TaxID=2483404 RepID=UPI0015574226|nr:PhzF family phenazine biosynthesis protein [Mesorhizobium sp. NZP2077]QKD17000.1 PhzF family phenazine biosynthesis protein [Mesorhizobium sp. NZP2077]
MPNLPFFTIDVFTGTRFGGNPLAVVIGGDALDDGTMQAIAAEFNLSETTFVLAPADPNNVSPPRPYLQPNEIPGIVRVQIERDANGAPVGDAIDASPTVDYRRNGCT